MHGFTSIFIATSSFYIMNIAIIDAHNHLHRFHHVLEEIGTPESELCEMWGKMLATIIRELKLHQAFAVFDPLKKEPKPGRPETPERIVRDQPKIEAMCKAMGIKVVKPTELNEEGDQLIADLWGNLPYEEANVYIISSDKDMAQLVGSAYGRETRLVRPENGTWKVYGRAEVKEKYGVWPEQIADYLTLMGDTTDGLKGVPGIGKKTAANLLSVHGSLNNILLKSSKKSVREFMDAFDSDELVLHPIEGLSQRLADNLSQDLKNTFARQQIIELTPQNIKLTPAWSVQPVSVSDAIRILGPLKLTDTLAKLMEGKLWSKQAKKTE